MAEDDAGAATDGAVDAPGATLVTQLPRDAARGPGYSVVVERVAGGTVLGERYALDRRLAVGGMGEVWLAEDQLLGRPVAVKLPTAQVRQEPGFDDRLLTEARHAAAVDHPGIAAVYDVSAAEPLPYLVLEYVEGRPLSRLIADEAPLPPDRARRLICQIAEALDAAHSAGLVHRDVKPANMLVTEDDTVKVTDFGISRAADSDSITRTGFVVGTAQYLSPEQAGGRPASACSDMYALGVVAYEMLSGRRPFDGDPLEVLRSHREEPVPSLPAAVPSDLAGLVLGLLAKDPADRPLAAQVVGRGPLPGPRPDPDATRALARPALPGPATSSEQDSGPRTAPHVVTPVRTDDDAPPGTRRPVLVLGAAAAILAIAVAAVGVMDSTGGPGASTDGGGAEQAAAAAPLPVAGVSLFHPGGSGGDRPDEVGLAADGNPQTAWTTQRYNSPEFGNLRPGVGLLFDLGEPREVREVRLNVASPGLDLRVHAGDDPGDGLVDGPSLGAVSDAQSDTVVPLDGPVTARYWVVWVERLPASGRHQAALAEAAFVG